MSIASSPAPALLELRRQIDARWPRRNKASDGIMGDAHHQARVSDHNQGDALDITHDPANGADLEALAALLIIDPRVHYIIWNRRIRNRAFESGAWRLYPGASPHTQHLHVSVHAEKRADTTPWKLPGDAVPELPEDDNRPGKAILASFGLLLAVALLVRHSERQDARRNRYRYGSHRS